MGFFGRLFGRSKTQVTPDELAAVALQAAFTLAFQAESSSHNLLQSAGVAVEQDNEYQVELVIYQLFLLDVVINRVFGREAEEVRRRLRHRFADAIGDFLEESGVDPGPKEERIRLLEGRYEEYAPALRRSMQSGGQTERGTLALPEVACRNILRSEAPLMAKTALASQWPVVLDKMREGFEEYELVTES